MDNSLKNLGLKLVEDAALNEEFSFQRGLIDELFPYIYEASKRMSSRGISRWLEANGTKLSAATIAKALRNPKPYWQEIHEEFEPVAIIFGRAHDVDPEEILGNLELFMHLEGQPPIIEGTHSQSQLDFYNEYEDAKRKLKEYWFSMPLSVREACLSNLTVEDKTSTEGDQASEEQAI